MRLLPLLLAACSCPDAAPEGSDPVSAMVGEELPDFGPDLGEPLTLEIPEIFAGRPAEILVRNMEPGDGVALTAARRPFDDCSMGVCRPDGWSRTWYGLADDEGVASVILDIAGESKPLWWRAAALNGQRSDAAQAPIQPTPDVFPSETFPDADGDDVSDRTERRLGTDPSKVDTDGDGIPDGLDPRPTEADKPDTFRPDEIAASDPSRSVKDPEFHVSGRIVWQDDTAGELWVGGIDPTTGVFQPMDARGELVATAPAPMSLSRNGPEWVDTDDGAAIAFVKLVDEEPHLARATRGDDGWSVDVLDLVGVRPLGSTYGMVRYFPDPSATHPVAWTHIDGSRQGRARDGFKHGRWAPDGKTLLMLADHRRTRQIAGVDTTNGAYEFWTEDRGNKGDNFAWEAPEHPGAIAFFAATSIQGGGHELRVYLRKDGETELAHTVPVPAGWPHIVSPELLVWGDKSYILYVASRSPHPNDNSQGHIFLASAFAHDAPVFRKLSDGPAALRKDPEAFTGGDRPWVYYTAVGPEGQRLVRRCELGL
jgi:hypothetical protein